MNGEQPNVEHQVVDRSAAFSAMFNYLYNGEFPACLERPAALRVVTALEAAVQESEEPTGNLFVLVALSEDNEYIFEYRYKLSGSRLNLEPREDFNNLATTPIVRVDADDINWATAYNLLFGIGVTVNPAHLPVYN